MWARSRGANASRQLPAHEVPAAQLESGATSLNGDGPTSTSRENIHAKTVVIVEDKDQRPVARAQVMVLVEADRLLLGTSDSQGIIGSNTWTGVGRALEAQAPGYLRTVLDLNGIEALPIHVTLVETATIMGAVESGSGARVPAGLRVAAWKTGSQPIDWDLDSRDETLGSYSTSATQSDGTFKIEGLNPGLRYDLSAAGKGFVCVKRAESVKPGQAEASIKVQILYGVFVRIREPNDAPLRTNVMAFGRAISWSLAPELSGLVKDFPRETIESGLAGLGAGTAMPEDRDNMLLLFASDLAQTQVGPVALEIDLPGYVPEKTDAWANRLDGELSFKDVHLSPIAGAWGDIIISIADQGSFPRPEWTGASFPEGILRLRPSEGAEIQVRIAKVPRDAWTLTGIPAGHYEARLELIHNRLSRTWNADSWQAIDVGPMPAALAVDAADRGAVDIEVLDGENKAHTGQCTILLRGKDKRGDAVVPFERPPYRLSWMNPGEYEVRLLAPVFAVVPANPAELSRTDQKDLMRRLAQHARAEASVKPGACARIQLGGRD